VQVFNFVTRLPCQLPSEVDIFSDLLSTVRLSVVCLSSATFVRHT